MLQIPQLWIATEIRAFSTFEKRGFAPQLTQATSIHFMPVHQLHTLRNQKVRRFTSPINIPSFIIRLNGGCIRQPKTYYAIRSTYKHDGTFPAEDDAPIRGSSSR